MTAPAPEAPGDARPVDDGEAAEPALVLRVLRRWRSALVLAPLVAGLLVAGSIGATKLWADIPERPLPAADVLCWNGKLAPAAECLDPDGVPGLRWVFPSFRPFGGRCVSVEREERALERPTEYACTYPFGPSTATITYSRRTSLEAGLAFLSRRYGGVEPTTVAKGSRLVYRDPEPEEGRYLLTVAYAEHPFAVTVEAPTARLRDQALVRFVQFRDAEHVRVRPQSKPGSR